MTISDDILSAYLDNELAPEEAARVRDLIARDAELAGRVERLNLAGALLREAYEPLARAPAPLRAAAGAQAPWRRFAAPAAAALAACAAGVVLGLSLRGAGTERVLALDDGAMIAAPALAHGLNQTVSGASARRGGVTVTPIYSFRSDEAAACRVFRSETSGVELEGAACRERGQWRIMALAPARESGGGYEQAGADEPEAVAAAVDRLWANEIGADEEAELIARGWR